MTVLDWETEQYKMVWSIWKPGQDERLNVEGMKIFDEIELDMTTQVPDGTYKVFHKYGSHEGIGEDAIVKDGEFDPKSTDWACFEAVCRTFDCDPEEDPEIDHIYIEALDWDEERQMFELIAGS